MKKLLFALFFTISLSPIVGMQQPLIYEEPRQTYDGEEIEINAFDDTLTAGWIRYKYLPDHKAKITLFELDEEMRNRKDLRVGLNLFQRFINEAVAHDCTEIVWTVHPISTIDSATLCGIYEKIVKKLYNSGNYILKRRDVLDTNLLKVEMTLTLKK